MKKYSILHPILFAFFSKNLYRDVARNWRGTGFLYLFLLLVLAWIPMTVQFQLLYANYIQNSAGLVNQLPGSLTIKNGEVSIDKPSPYYIKDPKTDKSIVVIDTSGKITSLQEAGTDTLLTKNKLIVRQDAEKTTEYDLSTIKDLTITKQQVFSFLEIYKRWAAIGFFIVMVVVAFIYRIIQALVYAGIGSLFFNRMSKANLYYQQILRIAVIAVTPAIILSTIFDFFMIRFPLMLVFYFVITMIYLYFGMSANGEGKVPVELETK